MTTVRYFVTVLAVLAVVGYRVSQSAAEPRPHVYLLRGLMNVFSLGMDTLAERLRRDGIDASVHNHSAWPGLADHAAVAYKSGAEGPIILIGHSLGADAVMEMAADLGARGVPVALAVPFDGTKSFVTPGNVGRLINLTQRDYATMRPGPDFHGSLANVDVRSDPSIDHFNIDKSPRLHDRVIREVLAVIGRRTERTRMRHENGFGAARKAGTMTAKFAALRSEVPSASVASRGLLPHLPTP